MPGRKTPSKALRWLGRAAVVLAVVLGLLALESRRRTVRLMETHPPTGHLVSVDGVRLHYMRAGTGPAVLLVHGMPGFLHDWRFTTPDKTSVFDDLARDHTVLALDRPGYGWSGLPDSGTVTLEEQADLVAALLDVVGIDHVTFVGHSYGGALGLALAVQHPEKVAALVHVAGVGYAEHTEPWLLERLLATPLVGELLRYCFAPVILPGQGRAVLGELFAPQAPLPEYGALIVQFLTQPRTLEQYGAEAVSMQASAAALLPQYPSITAPVTIVLGASDPLPPVRYSAEQLRKDVPHARFVEIPDVGHMVPHVRPQLVAAEVRRLTGQGDAPASAPAPAPTG